MKTSDIANISCAAKASGCSGNCPGYRTRNWCPPLIVIAVLATAAQAAQSGGVR